MIKLAIGLAMAAVSVPGPSEEQAVLQVTNEMFAALSARDDARMLALTVPEGGATALVEEGSGGVRLHHFTWPEFAAHLPHDSTRIEERLLDHLVRMDGDVAVIWARFDVHVNGRLFSCGTDHFDLVRSDGHWRVLNLTWNQRREGCGNG
jgi:hypothetical protein